ncbi:hypothetical protein WA556_002162 [Blastocystis sp. ATCC 50177/Nand II]
MSTKARIADYFFVTSVHVDKANPETENPIPEILDRFPPEDYEDLPFTENAEFFCLPEGARIEYREEDRRKPYIFTFCFTQSDGSQSYGTSLVFFEKFLLNGRECYNKYNQELYIPKALCILSLQPFFSLHSTFLKYLFRKSVSSDAVDVDIVRETERMESRRLSFRRKSLSSPLSKTSITDSLIPIERDIRYYIEALPYTVPGCHLHIPLFTSDIQLTLPPADCLPFCDPLCMKSLLGCLSLPHIQTVVSALLRDGKILLHSRNKYQLTLCSTALLALLCPVHYTLTFIPLLPAQLMDYIEAPTPYLIGIYSNTFALHATDLDSVLIAHLDFDKLTVPAGNAPMPISLPLLDSLALSAPLDYHLYTTDRPNSKAATSCVFSITAGPGRLGLRLLQERRQLVYAPPGSAAVLEEVTFIDSEESRKMGGVVGSHIDDCMLLGQNPAILEINDVPIVGLPLKRVAIILASATRPLTLLLQLGLRDIPASATPSAQATLLDVNVPNEETRLRNYYEDVRIAFFLFFASLFRSFDQFLTVGEDNDTKFDKAGFLASLPDDQRGFAEQFVQSQLFEGMIMVLAHLEETKEDDPAAEAKRVIRLMKKCAALLAEDEGQRESVEKIRAMLQPQGWKLKEVNLPAMKGSADDEEVVKMLAARDGKTFPRLEAKLWGEPMPRYEIWCVC